MQMGDPTGSGSGGQSAFNCPFRDEFDPRLVHSTRGILSMANSGANSNKSQFFITFKEANHLNRKHSVFGRVVGGMTTLEKIENSETNNKDKPLQEIKILKTVVLGNPIPEAEELLRAFVEGNITKRKSKSLTHERLSASAEPSAKLRRL